MLGCTVRVGDGRSNGPAQPYRHPQGEQFDDCENQAKHEDRNTQNAGDDAAQRRAEELVVEQRRPRFDSNENVVALAGIPIGYGFGRGETHGQIGYIDRRGFSATDNPRSSRTDIELCTSGP